MVVLMIELAGRFRHVFNPCRGIFYTVPDRLRRRIRCGSADVASAAYRPPTRPPLWPTPWPPVAPAAAG